MEQTNYNDNSKALKVLNDKYKGFSYNQRFEPTPTEEPPTSDGAFGAGLRAAAVNVLPSIAGIAAGGETGALAGSVAGPIGTIAGFIGGAIAGGWATKKVQDKAIEVVKGKQWSDELNKTLAEDRQQHPWATFIGGEAPNLITMKPSFGALEGSFNLAKRALTEESGSLAKHLATQVGKKELDDLINVAVGSGLNISMETYDQAREGKFDAIRLIGAGLSGALFNDPNKFGQKLGLPAETGQNIAEYKAMGDKTPASEAAMYGKEMPQIDQTVEGLMRDRSEVRDILMGNGEQNRMTEPRIARGERILGTTPKEVVPGDYVDVYRIDGHVDNPVIGERVTPNRVVAEGLGLGDGAPTVRIKADDLVRTSRGDYVYAPKDFTATEKRVTVPYAKEIPPETRSSVKIAEEKVKREGISADKKIAREAEAQKAIEAKNAQRIADREAALSELPKQIDEARTAHTDNVAKAKDVVSSGKEEIARTYKDTVAAVKKESNDAIAKARRDYQERVATIRSKENLERADKIKAIAKEAERRDARISAAKEIQIAKARKAEIKKGIETKKLIAEQGSIVEKSKVNVGALESKLKSLQAEKKSEAVSSGQKTVVNKDITVTESTVKAQKEAVAAKDVTPTGKEEAVTPPKTTIGSKEVSTEGIMRNAIKDSKKLLEGAEASGIDITKQKGTDFIEQRETGAKLIADKGVDEAIRLARFGSDAEIGKAGMTRSTLFESISKAVSDAGEGTKYIDAMSDIMLKADVEVSAAMQTGSLHRMALERSPYVRLAKLQKSMGDTVAEWSVRYRGAGKKEAEKLLAEVLNAGTIKDMEEVIIKNLC